MQPELTKDIHKPTSYDLEILLNPIAKKEINSISQFLLG